jgi:hypothetical protein
MNFVQRNCGHSHLVVFESDARFPWDFAPPAYFFPKRGVILTGKMLLPSIAWFHTLPIDN